MHSPWPRRCVTALVLCLALTVGSAPPARASDRFSSIVLTVGATEAERNLTWFSDSPADQVVSFAVEGREATTTRTASPLVSGVAEATGLTYRQATLTGLAPGTTYTYRVGSDATGWSASHAFTTGGDDVLEFLAFGDPQLGAGDGVPTDAAAWAATLEASLARHPATDFLLTLGDQVDSADSRDDYAAFLAPDELRSHPLATTLGNHDAGSPDYFQHFFMPNSSPAASVPPPGPGNSWYLQHGVLFLGFDTNNRDDEAHFAWAGRVLAEQGAAATWRVAVLHHGVYSTASHADDGDIAERLAVWPAALSGLDVDVVLSGHDHVYSRSHLINRGHAVGDVGAPASLATFPGETLWLTLNSATGSKYYDEVPDQLPFNAVSDQARRPSYTHARATDTTFRLLTRTVDGAVTDDVTLTRAPAGATPNPVPTEPPGIDLWSDDADALGDRPALPTTDPATGVTTAEARVLHPDDDAEEGLATGAVTLDSSDLELGEVAGGGGPERQLVGLRFDAVAVPVGATITSAHLQFAVDERTAGASDLTVAIEDADHAAPYGSGDHAVSRRSYRAGPVAWRPAAWPSEQDAGADQRSPDLSALVQAVVDRPGWFAGNALSFVVAGAGTRVAVAHDSDGAGAPRLVVTYTRDGFVDLTARITRPDDDVEQGLADGVLNLGSSDLELTQDAQGQVVGLRYANLQLPPGARIRQAHVQFTTDEPERSRDPFRVRLRAEASDDSAPFGTAAFALGRRPATRASIEWGAGVPAWDLEHEQRRWQRTPDLAAALQEVVDRPGWRSGNALTLLLEGEGTRSAEAFEGRGTAGAPTLHVVYAPGQPRPDITAGPFAWLRWLLSLLG